MFLLVIFEILGPFVNTLTADDEDSLRNMTNLTQPIQMQLSNQQKIFCIFLSISQIYIKFSNII